MDTVSPRNTFVVNMAPADIRKEGAGYDLPLAVGILATDEKVKPDKLSRTMMLGELSLDGMFATGERGFADSHQGS